MSRGLVLGVLADRVAEGRSRAVCGSSHIVTVLVFARRAIGYVDSRSVCLSPRLAAASVHHLSPVRKVECGK